MKLGLLQLNASDDPVENLAQTTQLIAEAAGQGAAFVLTPEVTNCVSQNRDHQQAVLQMQAEDQSLRGLRAAARDHGVWLSIGSLALKTGDADGRFANRSFLIAPSGAIVAQYDKIHMFDVTVSETESYRESAGYRPGARAVLANTEIGNIGLSICYDLRFPHLYRRLAQAGAEVLLVPSAFSVVTGAAHWEPLLRARAIENGCYVLAAAQVGSHRCQSGRPRTTYGHSLVVDPWGKVLLDMGQETGVGLVEIDLREVSNGRSRIAALTHDRAFEGP